MLKVKQKTATFVTNAAAVAVLAVGFAASGAFPVTAAEVSAARPGLYLKASPGNWSRPNTNRLKLAYPDRASQFGDPNYWPDEAFRGFDCDLPSAGCPSTHSIQN